MTTSKIILLGVGTVGALLGVSYLMRLNRLSSELEAVTRVSIYQVSLSGIDLKIDVTLKNPSGGTVKVKHPFVKLLHGTSVVASSEVKDVNITIPRFSQVDLEPVMINLNLLTLALTVPALVKEYRSTGKLSMTVKTITTLNDSLPYTQTDSITLGSGTV